MTTYVDGFMTLLQDVTVRFDITLGENGSADYFTIKIYEPGENAATGVASWVINQDTYSSQIMIKP